MRILTDLKDFKPDPSHPLILGLGNFDGLHLGHQALLRHVIGKAKTHQRRAALLTFSQHPQHVLHPQTKSLLLMSAEYKLFLLQECGVDLCFWLPFSEDFSKMKPEIFVEQVLVKQLRVREVCLGYNAHFGHDRKGDAPLMRSLAARFGFEFEEIKPVKAAGDFVSSSRIRTLIQTGDLEQTAICLGRPFSVLSQVVKGDGRGASLGFPTANLEMLGELMPPYGVYPVALRALDLERKNIEGEWTEIQVKKSGPWRQGVLNYGTRPTFKGSKAVAEVFILDFEGNLYGQNLEVCFYPRLRAEQAFQNPEALIQQIQKDIAGARHYFAQALKKPFTKGSDSSILL